LADAGGVAGVVDGYDDQSGDAGQCAADNIDEALDPNR
jgi:hypothetical protein